MEHNELWTPFLTERDKDVFKASGFGALGGFGKRPAFLIIDVSWAFCGQKPEPILESIKTWPNSCGAVAWDAIPVIDKVANACRVKGLDPPDRLVHVISAGHDAVSARYEKEIVW